MRVVSLLLTALVLAACVNIGPGQTAAPGRTVPPINVPSMPPINIPSLNLPSMPPINIPSGGGFPSIPPVVIPSGLIPGGTGTCSFVSAQEMAAIFGSAPIFTDDSSGDCAMTLSNGITVTVSVESNTDLQTSRILMGDSARDITVAGLPGLSGVILFVPTVQVQRGSDQLQVIGFAMASDEAFIAQLVQVATVAVSHWP